MFEMSAFSTILRGAATAAFITAIGIFSTGCGGGGSETPVSQDPADYPQRTVSIYTNDGPILETEQQAQFTIMLDEKTPVSLEVKIQFGGLAGLGTDFNADYTTSVVIPADSDSATVTITSVEDGLDELYFESTVLSIVTDSDYILGPDFTAFVDILDYYPELSVTANQTSINEGDGSVEFTISLSEYALSDMEIDFNWLGTATPGEDFTVDPATITILDDQKTATIIVTPKNDEVEELAETITLELILPRGTVAGAATNATVNILADFPQISVASAADTIAEGNGTLQFTIELSENAPADLDVTFALTGTATLGTDYTADPTTPVRISAGTKTAVVTITPLADTENEDLETVSIDLEVPANYQAGNSLTATVEIESLPQDIEIADLGMTLKAISRGTFMMGSPASDPMKIFYEDPQHQVTITQNFWMCSTETTVNQFQTFLQTVALAENPAAAEADFSPADTGVVAVAAIVDPAEGVNFDAAHCPLDSSYGLKGFLNLYARANKPMVGITRQAAINFCLWLTDRESTNGLIPAGYEFRLPTEAEWEYGCRAGTTTIFHYGDDEPLDLEGNVYETLGNHVWYYENCGALGKVTQVVGSPDRVNSWGLYDMHGNVSEFCYDLMEYYQYESRIDPVGLVDDYGGYALRGGSFRSGGWMCRSANRYPVAADEEDDFMGFRVVLAPIIAPRD